MKRRLAGWALAAFSAIAPPAEGQATGPGIPRIPFAASEVGSRLHLWNDLVGRVPRAQMFQGYLLVFQNRAQRIAVFDITNPRSPAPVGAVLVQGGGDEHVAPSAGARLLAGGNMFEFANPAAPRRLGRFGAYGLSVWPAFQWPYLYSTRTYDADGKSSPLAIVDFSDPSAPREARRVDAVSAVGFTTGSTHVVGNLLLVTSGDVYSGVSVWDISDPVNPELVSVNKTGPGMYTSQLYGKYLVTTGPKNLGRTAFFDFSDPENIRLEWEEDLAYSGDYAHFQNGHLFGSRLNSGRWVKYDIAARRTVFTGVVPPTPTGVPMPTRYAVPLGNMLFLGDPDNDGNGVGDGVKGTSSGALFVHQARPDSVGPSLLFFDPPDGAVRVPTTARVGLIFDEDVDNRRLNGDNIRIRPAGGNSIAGEYGHTLGTVHFTPRERLLPNTVYEVSVPRGAIRDWTGNGNDRDYLFRFSTGTSLPARPSPGRAGWWSKPRLVARPLPGGQWRIALSGWPGLLPGQDARIDFSTLDGRDAGSLSVSPEALRQGVVWRPGRQTGPLLMRLRLAGREIRGYAARVPR